jgi:hypothetical protein
MNKKLPPLADPILAGIARFDFDLDGFTARAMADEGFRRMITDAMLTYPHIMVYYNSFYIIEQVTLKAPELVYPYWDEIAGLLSHKNSYHRDFALILLANMITIDNQEKFSWIFDEYLRRLNDVKFMTGHCCAKYLKKIPAGRPDLTAPILNALLNIETGSRYSSGQMALIKFEVLAFIETVRERLDDRTPADDFILAARNCPSPKTRKKARELAGRFSLPVSIEGSSTAGKAEN